MPRHSAVSDATVEARHHRSHHRSARKRAPDDSCAPHPQHDHAAPAVDVDFEIGDGNPAAAATIREEIGRLIGDDLSKLKPGSPEAMALKEVLVAQGAWSQYLEVGIGPDAALKRNPKLVYGRLTGWGQTGPLADRAGQLRRLAQR